MKVRKTKHGTWVADCRVNGQGSRLSFKRKGDADEAVRLAYERRRSVPDMAGTNSDIEKGLTA